MAERCWWWDGCGFAGWAAAGGLVGVFGAADRDGGLRLRDLVANPVVVLAAGVTAGPLPSDVTAAREVIARAKDLQSVGPSAAEIVAAQKGSGDAERAAVEPPK